MARKKTREWRQHVGARVAPELHKMIPALAAANGAPTTSAYVEMLIRRDAERLAAANAVVVDKGMAAVSAGISAGN